MEEATPIRERWGRRLWWVFGLVTVAAVTRLFGWWGSDMPVPPEPRADEVVGTFMEEKLDSASQPTTGDFEPVDSGWVLVVPVSRWEGFFEWVRESSGGGYTPGDPLEDELEPWFDLKPGLAEGYDGAIMAEIREGLFSVRPVSPGDHVVCSVWRTVGNKEIEGDRYDWYRVPGCRVMALEVPGRLDLADEDFQFGHRE